MAICQITPTKKAAKIYKDCHVQFISDDKDLDTVSTAIDYLSDHGITGVECSLSPACGTTDMHCIAELTVSSIWNVFVISSNGFNGRIKFQQHVALTEAMRKNSKNIILLHAQENMTSFTSTLLSPFKQIVKDENWMLNLKSAVCMKPERFMDVCKDDKDFGLTCDHEPMDRLWKSDDIVRVKRHEKLKVRFLSTMKSMVLMRRNIKYQHGEGQQP